MGRVSRAGNSLGTYRDGVGVERCRVCLQVPEECYCTRPYWCTWCWETDGRKFRPDQPRCCSVCLELGRHARHWAIGPEDA